MLSFAPSARVKTPTLLQLEAVECGAAALGILLEHYDRIVPLAELREACGVSRDGSRASNIVAAARRYGMEARGYTTEPENLASIEPPYIVFWQFDHFVVVEGIGRKKVWINDPAVGHRSVSHRTFDEGFTGVVLDIRPGQDFEPGGKKKSVASSLLARLSGAWTPIAFAVLAGFLLAIPGLAIPALAKVFIDEVVVRQSDSWLRPLLTALLLAAAVQALLRFLQLQYLTSFRMALAARLSAGFLGHVLRLPIAFYQQRFAGEIAGRVELNGDVADALAGKLARAVIDATMMILYAALMLSYDVVLASIVMAAAVLDFVALGLLSKHRVEANMRVATEQAKLHGAAVAGLQRMETIKSTGQEIGFFSRWAGLYTNASNARQRLDKSNQLLGVLPGFLQLLVMAGLLSIGGLRVIDGVLSIGTLVALQSLTLSFLRPVSTLIELGATIQKLQGDLVRLDDVLIHEPAPLPAPADDTGNLARARLRGELAIRDLTFGYNRLEEPLIERFSLHLPPGHRVALVGASGSGKTTIARLIAGLLHPWEGEILLDGRPRSELPRPLICKSLALVDQELAIFEGTVRDNLTLWDDTVPEEDIERACRDAQVHEVIQQLPGAFDSELAEGGRNLSGGQRQRLEIARALVHDPTVLLLDEATSALDSDTEHRIFEGIRTRGCSCVVVAHRLSTVRDCDEIIVLESGRVVERGRHDDLLRSDGAYARLLETDDRGREAGS